ncbi:unnamed protein product, partial [Mesorhabditis spiculigera]
MLIFLPYFTVTFVFMDRIMHTDAVSIPVKVYLLIFYSVLCAVFALVHVAFLCQSLAGHIPISIKGLDKTTTDYVEMSTTVDREDTLLSPSAATFPIRAVVRYIVMETISTTILGVILCFWTINLAVHGYAKRPGFLAQRTQYTVLLISWVICFLRMPAQGYLVRRNRSPLPNLQSRGSQSTAHDTRISVLMARE